MVNGDRELTAPLRFHRRLPVMFQGGRMQPDRFVIMGQAFLLASRGEISRTEIRLRNIVVFSDLKRVLKNGNAIIPVLVCLHETIANIPRLKPMKTPTPARSPRARRTMG